ncbi:DUF3558 domain-containing protein [Streptomyces sp. BI20]|uniref:DUF3558 domain-containing protein n=1 Tax=Streptomyces sp. BI20 TaxID=3403460 RepID=UPI003C70F61B
MLRKPGTRRAALSPLVALAAVGALVAGCSAGGDTGDVTGDSKPGDGGTSAAAPGKYRVLPSPCKAVGAKSVKRMVPAPDAYTTEQREQLYAGTPDTAYDGDRRVGCRWNAAGPDTTRQLRVTFERVVSYDRSVGDEVEAHRVWERLLTDAGLPAEPTPGGSEPATPPSTAPASPAPSASAASSAPGANPQEGGTPTPVPSGSGGAPSASGSPAPSASGPAGAGPLASRRLDSLGTEAFLDDRLDAAGSMAQSRTVRVVFRTSNVIVTVEYGIHPKLPGAIPGAAETQALTRELAEALAEGMED